ncbi:endocuticle structural glycoprotein SgAbd-5 [Musca vetustissima]|uniref:endocuticle structural glycoprotein SgAbd-5 n=1 Tax=Musca vetustissima TaxID=27455 RepID=UPI002AB625EF|nr:endocuticle structural glycoprotein SgAbd-5 [Musca vetustissima]
MKSLTLSVCVTLAITCCLFQVSNGAVTTNENGESQFHFGFKTNNGYQRVEDIKFNKTSNAIEDTKDKNTEDPVEFRGGYSFISADGYEYTVKYKANKNGFQPYVTAHKIKDSP